MKKAILTLLMIPAFVGMLFSCSEVKTDAKKLEGKWNIVEVKGEKILKEGLPNMEFDMKDNKVHGNAGCNIFNSTVVLERPGYFFHHDQPRSHYHDGLSGYGDRRCDLESYGKRERCEGRPVRK